MPASRWAFLWGGVPDSQTGTRAGREAQWFVQARPAIRRNTTTAWGQPLHHFLSSQLPPSRSFLQVVTVLTNFISNRFASKQGHMLR